jgi:hypothetical protein
MNITRHATVFNPPALSLCDIPQFRFLYKVGRDLFKKPDVSVCDTHPAIPILPPYGMMSLKDLKEHHYTKCPTLLSAKN